MSKKRVGQVPKCGIVVELLNEENYVDWRVQVRTYLIGEDLWDTVEAIDEPPSSKPEGGDGHGGAGDSSEEANDQFMVWRKKNARALHAIQISCGSEAFSEIRDIDSAKIAWNTLAAKFGSRPRVSRLKTMASMARSPITADDQGKFNQ